MRVGVVRSDMGRGLHLDDLLSRNQYPYASQVPGQSRAVRLPTDAELSAAIGSVPAPASATATETSATVDTSVNDTLRVRASLTAAFSVIAVTSGVGTAKTLIRDDLNAFFAANSVPLVADIVGTNQIRIRTTSGGPSAYLEIDSVANGSTLSTAIGYAVGGVVVTGTAIATLLADVKTAVYPTSVTIDVSSATVVGANAAFAGLSPADQAALTLAVADLVAPQLVETGYALASFALGKMAAMRVATFQPGGARAGLPAGIAIAAVENDGSTPFTYP